MLSGATGAGAGSSSDSTPPPTPLIQSERSDGYSHVHIFQCVMEVRESEPEGDNSLSLVQTIMAAFGRRPTSKGSMSTPPKLKVNIATSNKAPGNATPGGQQPAEGPVRCLSFYLVVRFPKTSTRPTYSRSSSTVGPRSRTNSVNTDLSVTSTTSRGEQLEVGIPTAKRSSESYFTSLYGSGPGPAPARETRQVSPETVKTPVGSRTSSRAPSRTRKRSRARAPSSRKAKVFIQLSDERAVEAVRNALSVGGMTESSDLEEDESIANANANTSANAHARRVEETVEENSPMRSDQKRRPTFARSVSQVGARDTRRAISRDQTASARNLTVDIVAPDEAETQTRGRQPSAASLAAKRLGEKEGASAGASAGPRPPSHLSVATVAEELQTPKQDLEKMVSTLGEAVEALKVKVKGGETGEQRQDAQSRAHGLLASLEKTMGRLEVSNAEDLQVSWWTRPDAGVACSIS